MKVHYRLTLAALLCFGLAAPWATAAQLALFDRLAGTWDVTYDIYGKDGALSLYHGQVFYNRILNGDTRQRWTAVYIFPAKGYSSIVSGGEADGRIVLTGRDPDGTMQRWSIDNVGT